VAYWNNIEMEGDPVYQSETASLTHDWGTGSPAPGVDSNNFSAHWEGELTIEEGGAYRFTTRNDDGIRVWVGDQLVIDDWAVHPVQTNSNVINLDAGTHEIDVDYFELTGDAVADLSWTRIGPTLAPAPTAAPAADSPCGETYTVRSGDWLSRIAQRCDTSVAALVQANPEITNPNIIEVGMVLEIPGGMPGMAPDMDEMATPTLWQSAYWNNTDLEGDPVLQRSVRSLTFDWGSGSPGAGVDSDRFSAHWERDFVVEGGIYRFVIRNDDGIRVRIDDQVILDDWAVHPVVERVIDVPLQAGEHEIDVRYFEQTGDAEASVVWERVGDLP
jgi:hypothetical protein